MPLARPVVLDEAQKSFLEEAAASASNLRLRRKARILLAYAAGLTTREVADQVGLSRGRARFWRRRFLVNGMQGLERLPVGNPVEPEENTMDEPAPVGAPEIQPHPLLSEAEPAAAAKQKGTRPERKTKKGRPRKIKKENPFVPEPEIPFPEVPLKPGILAEDLLSEAGRKTFLYHFAVMLSHEEGTRLGEDIEALHDMRVATRRMRAAFDVFSSAFDPKLIKPHVQGLRAAGRALGAVRDLDVFIEKAQGYINTLPEGHDQDLTPLTGSWLAQRSIARQRMLAHLDSQEYLRFKRDFNVFVQTTAAGVKRLLPEANQPDYVYTSVPVLIYQRLASVLAFTPILGSATVTQLHALRIEFKRLRYTLEYFKEVLGPSAVQVIDEVKRMQDHLGDLNDAVVACHLLNQFLESWQSSQESLPLTVRISSQPIAAYLAHQYAEQHRLLVTFPAAWEHFNSRATRICLAEAVAEL